MDYLFALAFLMGGIYQVSSIFILVNLIMLIHDYFTKPTNDEEAEWKKSRLKQYLWLSLWLVITCLVSFMVHWQLSNILDDNNW
jgi:hypothetical protein